MADRADATAAFDCVHCGACCFSEQPRYIRVFHVDLSRLDPRAREHLDGDAMRFTEGRCSALCVDAAAGTTTCAIYGQRPDACRWLEPGSAACREQIALKGAMAQAARGA